MNFYNHENGSGIFIQIGACAGDLNKDDNYRDGFTEFVKGLPISRIKKIVLVEPNPHNIPLLKECWKDYSELAVIYEVGIVPKTHTLNTIDFYYNPKDGSNYQVASIDKNHIFKHYGNDCELEKLSIQTRSLESLINEITTEEVELLALDIEGIDAEVILDLDFNNIRLKYLSFEYIHLIEKFNDVYIHLTNHKFVFLGKGVDHNGYDVLFVKTAKQSVGDGDGYNQ